MIKNIKKKMAVVLTFVMTLSLLIQPQNAYAATPYETFLSRLDNLEAYTQDYIDATSSTAQSLDLYMLIYVRSAHYNDAKWALGGIVETAYMNYITDRDTSDSTDVALIRGNGASYSVDTPSEDKVEITHLFGTMNLIEQEANVVGGWGGDLIDLYSSTMRFIPDTKSLDDMIDTASTSLENNSSGFGPEDRVDDMDAENIMKIRDDNPSTTYADIISDYYDSVTEESRVEDFADTVFSLSATDTQDDFRNAVFNKFTNDNLIKVYGLITGMVSGSTFTKPTQVKAMCYAFADYMYLVLNPQIPPTITTIPPLADGTVGTAYSETLTADGSTPLTWSVDSGVLPQGLTLDPDTGIISGTPTYQEAQTFTIKVSNAYGDATISMSIDIEAAAATPPNATPSTPSVASPSNPSNPSTPTTHRSSGGSGSSYTGPSAEAWRLDSVGWWYRYPDGSYPKKTWAYLSYKGKSDWYYFNASGYMLTGWWLDEQDNHWYYLDPRSGAMYVGHHVIDGTNYYFNTEVPDASGWQYDSTTKEWQYVEQNKKTRWPYGALLGE